MEDINFNEYSLIECRSCCKVMKRYLAGMYPNGKDKIWVNEEGQQFNGRTCPSCDIYKKSLRQRTKRRIENIKRKNPYSLGQHE